MFSQHVYEMNFILFETPFHRRKQSSGEPSTFHTHLLQHGIAVTEFPRYVGSRWNLLFQMALTLLQHFRVLKDYIKDILAKDAMR